MLLSWQRVIAPQLRASTMTTIDRRAFLASSLGGLAAGLTWGRGLFAEETPGAGEPSAADGASFSPPTLFLTWQTDPTTTMTIQWVGPEVPYHTSIHYRPLDAKVWQVARTLVKPFPDTDLKVHRCE